MVLKPARVHTARHQSSFGDWESITCGPDPRLAPYVISYEGYFEHAVTFSRRLELPGSIVPLIINLGPAYRVTGPGNMTDSGDYGSFMSGMTDAHVVVEATGPAYCIQVNFSPIGAHRLLGMPMSELTNRTLRFDDVFAANDRQFVAQLDDTPDWAARFDLIDTFIIDRISRSGEAAPGVSWAWRRLQETGGAVAIAVLADEIGWSRKHLIARFREQVGLPPKTVARIVRFNRALAQLEGADEVHWASIAYGCGYYDQAHFNRDFRAFTGGTPTEYLRRRIPNGGGLLGE